MSSIRKDGLNMKTPICYITADASMTSNDCIFSGGNDILYKPVSYKSVSSVIKKYIKN